MSMSSLSSHRPARLRILPPGDWRTLAGMKGDLDLALELADLADTISLPRFRAADLMVETKPDLTPVTETDRAVEDALRKRLAEVRPNDAVIGEERGSHDAGTASVRWIIDPIDGTKNYVRGIPIYATLIAVERDGSIEAGVASAPAIGRRWWAARGEGAWVDGRPMRGSEVKTPEDGLLLYGGLSGWESD